MKLRYLILTLMFTSCVSTPKAVETQVYKPVVPAAPTCPKINIDNRSDEPFNDLDQWNLDVATKHCKELYKNSPCLVKFIKFAPTRYGAICGGYRG